MEGTTMSRYARLLLPVLLLALALALASCGGSGGVQGSSDEGDGGMQGMNHDGETNARTRATETTGGMAGMDHSPTGMGAEEMLMENGEYSDERFIDAMVPHHQGAIEMAEVALDNAEHEEVRALAEDIVSAQEAEIEELRAIKREEFGTSEVPAGMSAEEMEGMGIMTDPRELADQEPFDRAFIDNMIPHHESAIEMANAALKESENPEIRKIAGAIVNAQEKEIAQMQRWREEWYPEG
jgi:uncharacterized protein (DUF305 family)